MRALLPSLLGVFCSAVMAADPLLEQNDVFPHGLDGIKSYRIPGVVVTTKGTVLAYAEARRNSSADWGEIEVRLRRSTDGGRTWEAAKHVAHHGARIEGNPHKKEDGGQEQTVNNPVALVDRDSGAVVLLYCINYARCFSMRSTDDGVTWSAPEEITAAFEPFRAKYDWKVIATGPGHGIQLKTGDHKPSAAATIFSDDRGRTWQAGDLAVPDEGEFGDPNETTLAELSDGRVMLVTRNVSKPNRKLVTFSPDGARQWSVPVFHEQLWEPICMAGLLAHPAQPGTLLFSCPHSLTLDGSGKEIPGSRAKRQNLTIKLSRDDGKTWPVSKTLEPGPSAYSDLGVLPDGTVLCLYEDGKGIRMARFNLEWLTAQ